MISVIGTVFVDIKGYAHYSFNPAGRNIGSVEIFYGGVGNNVARNLAYLGLDVNFISSVDSSATGKDIVCKLHEDSIRTEYLLSYDHGMGIWHAIFDNHGNLAASISQQLDFKPLYNLLVERIDEIIEKSEAIVLELDLSPEIASFVACKTKKANIPLYVLISNLSVFKSRPALLNSLSCFVCNNIEAKEIVGNSLSNSDYAKTIAQKYSIGQVHITCGEKGSYAYSLNENETIFQPPQDVQVVDVSGAGDAFFSGVVYALLNNFDLSGSAYIGSKIAANVIENKGTVITDYTVNKQTS